VLQILQERLTNEITRLAAVKAFETIASSTHSIDLSNVMAAVLKELATFLRKSNRQLRQASVSTLRILIQKFGSNQAVAPLLTQILTECAALINDSDLHLTHLTLQLCIEIFHVSPSTTSSAIATDIYPKAVQLLRSPLLQGLALEVSEGVE
jgi:cullin-associated NEDD8-dissociated protein 1